MAYLRRLCARQEGLTLIEMLVVIGIMGILASIAVPKMFEAVNKAKESEGTADLEVISLALEYYYAEHRRYPTYDSTITTLTPSQQVSEALVSTNLLKKVEFQNGFENGYVYGSTPNGNGYILVDLKRFTGTGLAFQCGGVQYALASAQGGNLGVIYSIDPAHINQCTGVYGKEVGQSTAALLTQVTVRSHNQ